MVGYFGKRALSLHFLKGNRVFVGDVLGSLKTLIMTKAFRYLTRFPTKKKHR